MTVEKPSFIANIHTHSVTKDQHNTTHSSGDLYYEIQQVKESFKQKSQFPLHQCQRVPGRSTILNIIPVRRLKQVPFCRISDLLLHFLVWLTSEKQGRVTNMFYTPVLYSSHCSSETAHVVFH